MANEMIVETEEEFYNDLRDEPCIVCGDPYAYVLGSYRPENDSSVLYYALCENCFNNGRIPTARIEAAYKSKFGKVTAWEY